ncbi:MAG: hypothetical protein AAF985_17510 [Bacteroidota bacterium]
MKMNKVNILLGFLVLVVLVDGMETEDVVVLCSVSINNSFEWIDNNNNGTYEPTEGDVVVDMGVRDLIPSVE